MSVINMIGQPCPMPVIEAKKALRLAGPGQSVSLLVDNDLARRNLEKMAVGRGCGFSHQPAEGGNILVSITAGSAGRLDAASGASGLVVAVGRQGLGAGSDELGQMLMKSFIHSLTELDAGPEHLLFFNGGVLLATEGSTAVDDLAALAEKGCVIASCGACLNYYGLAEKLKIGAVTNMYAIVETMAQAGKLISL